MVKNNKAVARWLFICCFMVAVMVNLGGVTRLTESGLSMTGWKPVTGWLPPLDEIQWHEEFVRYQQSPQYQKVNMGMSVDEFKGIFWLEYIHRLVGRCVGLLFLIPLVYFAAKKAIDKKLALGLGGIFALGGIQGVVGWMMVSSGLKDDPRVSQYWLAFHLSMAFIVFALLFLVALRQNNKNESLSSFDVPSTLKNLSLFITLLIFIQVIMGAFVAGLDAGLIYNTFPLMDGSFMPDGLFTMQPKYINIFADIKTVQFTHRIIAYIVAATIVLFWILSRKVNLCGRRKWAIWALLAMVFIQFGLGVLTLIHAVPVALASIHQMGALLLFAISLYVNYTLWRKGKAV